MTMFLKKKIPKRIMTVYVTVNVEKKLKVFVGKTARKCPDLPALNQNSANSAPNGSKPGALESRLRSKPGALESRVCRLSNAPGFEPFGALLAEESI